MVNLLIGSGTPTSGIFNAIDWSSPPHFVNIGLDTAGGLSFTAMGGFGFYTVPYAYFAAVADSAKNDGDRSANNEVQTLVFSNDTLSLTLDNGSISLTHFLDTTDLGNIQQTIIDSSIATRALIDSVEISLTNLINGDKGFLIDRIDSTNQLLDSVLAKQTADSLKFETSISALADSIDVTDRDSTNELQTLQLFGDSLDLTKGGSVDLSQYNQTDSINSLRNRVNTLQSTIQPTVTQVGTNTNDILTLQQQLAANSGDSSSTNELQTLSRVGDTLVLSNTNDTISLSDFTIRIDTTNDRIASLQIDLKDSTALLRTEQLAANSQLLTALQDSTTNTRAQLADTASTLRGLINNVAATSGSGLSDTAQALRTTINTLDSALTSQVNLNDSAIRADLVDSLSTLDIQLSTNLADTAVQLRTEQLAANSQQLTALQDSTTNTRAQLADTASTLRGLINNVAATSGSGLSDTAQALRTTINTLDSALTSQVNLNDSAIRRDLVDSLSTLDFQLSTNLTDTTFQLRSEQLAANSQLLTTLQDSTTNIKLQTSNNLADTAAAIRADLVDSLTAVDNQIINLQSKINSDSTNFDTLITQLEGRRTADSTNFDTLISNLAAQTGAGLADTAAAIRADLVDSLSTLDLQLSTNLTDTTFQLRSEQLAANSQLLTALQDSTTNIKLQTSNNLADTAAAIRADLVDSLSTLDFQLSTNLTDTTFQLRSEQLAASNQLLSKINSDSTNFDTLLTQLQATQLQNLTDSTTNTRAQLADSTTQLRATLLQALADSTSNIKLQTSNNLADTAAAIRADLVDSLSTLDLQLSTTITDSSANTRSLLLSKINSDSTNFDTLITQLEGRRTADSTNFDTLISNLAAQSGAGLADTAAAIRADLVDSLSTLDFQLSSNLADTASALRAAQLSVLSDTATAIRSDLNKLSSANDSIRIYRGNGNFVRINNTPNVEVSLNGGTKYRFDEDVLNFNQTRQGFLFETGFNGQWNLAFSSGGGIYDTAVYSGEHNFIWGRGTGGGLTSGSHNIALGRNVMVSNQTGEQNVALLENSLNQLTSGRNNIAIGERAGEFLKTGNSNIFLNAQGDTGSYSQRLYIGNQIYGDGVADILQINATLRTSLGGDTLIYPSSDGTNGQVLTTDGNGNLTFQDAPTGTDDQTLTLNNSRTLTIEDGNTVDLRSLSDSAMTAISDSAQAIRADIAALDFPTDTLSIIQSNEYNRLIMSNGFLHVNLDSSLRYQFRKKSLYTTSTNMIFAHPQNGGGFNFIFGSENHAVYNSSFTGEYNIIIGRASGDSNLSGDNNIALGRESLSKSISSSNNIAIGFNSLQNLITGGNNIGLGINSGSSLIHGTGNVFINNPGTDTSMSSTLLVGPNQLLYGNLSSNELQVNGAFRTGISGGDTLTYPSTDGTNGQVLTTDGSGNLTFQNAATGTDDQTLTLNNSRTLTIEDGNTIDLRSLSDSAITALIDTANDIRASIAALSFETDTLNTLKSIDKTSELIIGEFPGGSKNELRFYQNNKLMMTIDSGKIIPSTGTGGVFIGGGAGDNENSTIKYNVFIGSLAGSSNTSGTGVFIGYAAGGSQTTGRDNTFVGDRAGNSMLSGNYNVALGTFALRSATSSFRNTAIGYFALNSHTSGHVNTAVGAESMENLITGSSNVAIGRGTGESTELGDRNTIIGEGAGGNIVDSDWNTFIGYQAGRHSSTVSNQMGVVKIGYESGMNDSTNNTLFIDNSSISTPLIWGDFASNILQVGGTLKTGPIGGDTLTYPTTDGTNGQVLTTDGSGVLTFQDVATSTDDQTLTLNNSRTLTIEDGNTVDLRSLSDSAMTALSDTAQAIRTDISSINIPFSTAAGVTSNSGGIYGVDDFVFGSPSLSDDGNSIHDSRMLFDKSKSAFRAGYTVTLDWEEDSIGDNSVGIGANPKAKGNSSVAFGLSPKAIGDRSVAIHGDAFGFHSISMGSVSKAVGDHAVGIGNNANAVGEGALAIGGTVNEAFGDNSIAMGYASKAYTNRSTAIGNFTIARSFSETALGMYNTDYTPASTTFRVNSDRLLVVGNGNGPSTRRDAFIIYKSGDAVLHGNLALTNGPGTDSLIFPTTDGTNGQILTTDGSGVLTFQDAPTSTDDQTLTLNNSRTLTIEDGNTVDLRSLSDSAITALGDTASNIRTALQTANSQQLSALSDTASDIRTALTDSTAAIRAAISASGDNLGNHTATQNLQLNGKFLSNDGGNEGISINNDGDVGINLNGAQRAELDIEGTQIIRSSDITGVPIIGEPYLFLGFDTTREIGVVTSLNTPTTAPLKLYGKEINLEVGTSSTSWFTNGIIGLKIDSAGQVGIGTNSPTSKFHVEDNVSVTSGGYASQQIYSVGTASSTSFQRGLNVQIIGTDGENEGVFSIANGISAGLNTGVFGRALNGQTNYGVRGNAGATPAGTNFAMGVNGSAVDSSGGINYGVYGTASGSNFINRGVVGVITGTNTTNDAAVYGIANSTGKNNVALYGRAANTNTGGVNYGLYSRATGADTNYAAYFAEGEVYIQNTLIMPNGATNGYVLTTDADGYTSWQAPASGADNLGNHTATTNIQLNGNYLSNDGGNEGIAIDNDGNVGVGTQTPSTALSVEKSSSSSLLTLKGASDGFLYSGILLQNQVNNNSWEISNRSLAAERNGLLFQYYDGTTYYQQLFIDSIGRTGFNTMNPRARVDIVGLAIIDSLRVNDSFSFPNTDGTNGQVLTTDGSGNLTFQNAPTGTDDQTLTLNNSRTLTIEDGNTVDLRSLSDSAISALGDTATAIRAAQQTAYSQQLSALSDTASTLRSLISTSGSDDQTLQEVLAQGKDANNDSIYNLGYIGLGTSSPNATIDIQKSTDDFSISVANAKSSSSDKKGVFSNVTGLGTGDNYAVYGEASGGTGDKYGVYGSATGTSGNKYGVYGTASGANAFAGYFDGGDVYINNNLRVDGYTLLDSLSVFRSTGNTSFNLENTNTTGWVGLTIKNDAGIAGWLWSGGTNYSSSSIRKKLRLESGPTASGIDIVADYGSIYFEATSNQNGGNSFVMDSLGRFGVGTTTPTAKAEIAGRLLTDSLTINDFTFPIADGTNGQVLQTDGSGNVTWQNAATDTDDQTLSLTNSNRTLNIADGNSIDVRVLADTSIQANIDSSAALRTALQTANSQQLSALSDTASAIRSSLSTLDSQLSTEIGDTASDIRTALTDSTAALRSAISSAGDNLGNHTATTNIQLGANYLSNDGGNEGISVSNTGLVTATPATTGAGNLALVTQGDVRTSGIGTGYYLTNTNIGITGNNGNSGDMRLLTGGSPRITIDAGGGVSVQNNLSTGGFVKADSLSVVGATGNSVINLQNTNSAGWTGIDIKNDNGTVGWLWTAGSTSTYADVRNKLWLESADAAHGIVIDASKGGIEFGVESTSRGYQDFVMDSLGRFGVGTKTPTAKAEINGRLLTDSLTINNFTFPTADGTNGQVLQTNGTGAVSWATLSGDNLGNHTATTNINLNGNYLSGDGDAEGIHVSAAGNVTIGSNKGFNQFGVWQEAASAEISIFSETNSSTLDMGASGAGESNTISAFKFRGDWPSFSSVVTGDDIFNIEIAAHNGSSSTVSNAMEITVDDVNAGNIATRIDFSTVNSSGTNSERLSIDKDGNVGIGTTNPNFLLDVAGTASVNTLNINSAFTLPTADGTSGQVLTTDGSGNVSWGTVSTDLGDTTQIADADNNTKVEVEQGANDNTIRLTTNGTERMQINGGGSVMIGTTTPTGLFTVSDNSNNYTGVFSNTASTSITEAVQANATGTSGSNTGVRATANGAITTNYGVYGTANGTGATNYAVYADAQNGTANYALYANAGDVVVNDSLRIQTNTAIAGSILKNSGTGASYWAVDTLTCPAGFTKVNDDFCIETAERTATTWFSADSVCTVNGFKLPDYSDWYGATASKTLTNETNDWEWVSNISQNNMMVVGNGGRRNRTFYDPETQTATYRCIYRKQ